MCPIPAGECVGRKASMHQTDVTFKRWVVQIVKVWKQLSRCELAFVHDQAAAQRTHVKTKTIFDQFKSATFSSQKQLIRAKSSDWETIDRLVLNRLIMVNSVLISAPSFRVVRSSFSGRSIAKTLVEDAVRCFWPLRPDSCCRTGHRASRSLRDQVRLHIRRIVVLQSQRFYVPKRKCRYRRRLFPANRCCAVS